MHTPDHIHIHVPDACPSPGPTRPQPPAGDALQVRHDAQRALSDHAARGSSSPGDLEYASWLQLIRHHYA